MARWFIPKTGLKAIDKAIEAMFARLKVRFLGKRVEPKQIRFAVQGFDKPVSQREDFSLPGLFDEAARSEGMKPNQQLKSSLTTQVEQYLDAHQELAKAKVRSAVQTFMTEAEMAKEKPNIEKVLGKQLQEVMIKVSSDVQTVVDKELDKAKNVSTLDSIIKVGLSVNIQDPTVVFIGPNDSYCCDDCRRLFFLPDGITPKVWKVSELKYGYSKHGDTRPSATGSHPFCRHAPAPMMPGFGFKGGRVAYIEPGYDVWADQRK
jgi:hypothetical protein